MDLVEVLSEVLDTPVEMEKGTVAQVDETVDLEKEAEFDFNQWLQDKGLNDKAEIKQGSELNIKKTLEYLYSVPEIEKVDRIGQCTISLSAELETVSYEDILTRFLGTGKLSEKERLLKRGGSWYQEEEEIKTVVE